MNIAEIEPELQALADAPFDVATSFSVLNLQEARIEKPGNDCARNEAAGRGAVRDTKSGRGQNAC
jgi:hypothetical protein